MNISGIGSYAGHYNYNSIKINNVEAGNVTPSSDGSVQQKSVPAASQQPEIRREQNFNSEDYAKQYQPQASYDLKGANSDVNSLDKTAKVSDSQQSQMMQQYQLFMGETQTQGMNYAAMNTSAVRGVENFAF